jgi:Na+/H+ antiporter NhaD/arsenite permease-like protein
MMLPFGLLLAAMALGPVLVAPWWHNHYGKVALALGAVAVGYYFFGLPPAAAATVGRTADDYLSFMAMMGSLYVISGGIHLELGSEMTPGGNVVFLLCGALLANLLGTVGASLLLIRPWLRCNEQRLRSYHVIFFIFIISNAGGCLTPFGNPPLFLGYLKGVPLWWVAEHCWPMWLCGIGCLLAVFFVFDIKNPRRAAAPPPAAPAPWHLDGWWNLFFLAVVLGAVFVAQPPYLREALMAAAGTASYFATGKQVHQANRFDFHPLREVAVLFAGIFASMMPALDWLQNNASAVLGAHPPAAVVFWSAGALSSLLDNAPAYLSFLGALFGTQHQALGHPAEMKQILDNGPLARSLAALSVAAVFFGGCTYIGNGPNFMVKAIAEGRQAALPGFLGYIFKWTLPVMLPLLVGIWLIFFR